jgi:transcriptional regulator with XRE-family HTH domain
MIISQKEIGKRISGIRKEKGFSQQDIANILQMSRPSFTQMELGNRNLSVIELKKISDALTISMDKLLSNDYVSSENLIETKQGHTKPAIRISVPTLNVDKMKNILLYILEKCAGKANVGETILYKLLYFSDFNYYEIFEDHLSGAEYRKLAYGPVPQKLDSIIYQMIEQKQLKRLKLNYHGFPQTRYIPLVKPNLLHLKASEKDIIDKVIEQYSDWSASALSDYSHKAMPWLASNNGDLIDYELVFYRETPYTVRNYQEKENAL